MLNRLHDLLLPPPHLARQRGPAGRRLPDLLLLLRSAGHGPSGPAARPAVLLPCSAGPCGPAGRRWTDGPPDLLLLPVSRWAGPSGPAAAASLGRPLRPGRAVTDGGDGRTTTRPAAAVSLGRPMRPGRAATKRRTSSCAAAPTGSTTRTNSPDQGTSLPLRSSL
jgi:hypothetical protein